MITHRQFVILRAIKNTPGVLGLGDLKKALTRSYKSDKYDDDILKSELKELKESEYVSYSFADNTIIWLAVTPKGSVAVKEFWKGWFSQNVGRVGAFLLKEAIIPIIVSILTAIITTSLCLGGKT